MSLEDRVNTFIDEMQAALTGHTESFAHALTEIAFKRPQFEYNSFTYQLAEYGKPSLLLSADPSRSRALINCSNAGVYIGSLSTLQSPNGQGYVLPIASGDEFMTQDELYVLYNPLIATGNPAYVSVYVERYK